MDDNTIFNNQQQQEDQSQDVSSQDQVLQDQSGDIQTEAGGEGEPPDSTGDGTGDDGYYEEQGPSGISGFFSNPLVKKILIGVGIFIILIILLLIFLPRNGSKKDITLVWWGLWEDSAAVQPIIDDFEKQNPHIKIQYIKQDPEKYRDTLLTRIKNGSGPDIFRYHNTWVPLLTKTLAPLPKDVITVDEFKKEYYPVIQSDLTVNGAIYGIPLGVDSLAMFVNTDILKSAGQSVPVDWNQFTDVAKRVTVKDKDSLKIQTSGAALGQYDNIKHAPDILSMMFLQQGVNLSQIDQATDDLIAALTFYASFSRGEDSVWDSSLDNSELAFAKGDLAMYFGFSWDIFTIEQLKNNSKLKYEIHPVPGLFGGKSISVASYWVEGVSTKSKYQKEAMLFMHYLTQEETLEKLYNEESKTRLFGEPYPRVDMANKLKENSMVYPFVSQLNNAGSSYFASNTLEGDTGFNKRLNDYLGNSVNGVINNNNSADSQVKTLQDGIRQVFQENGLQIQ